MKKRIELFTNLLKSVTTNNLFLLTGALIFMFPLIGTFGQFLHTSYFGKTVPVLILFWPGSDFNVKIGVFVWLFMGLVFISYLAGIGYMLQKRTFGKVIFITVLFFIVSIMLRNFLSHTFGLIESPMPDLAGKANASILAQWHNPIWEEIVFRGIPLLILLGVEKYITKKRTTTGVLLYMLIPAVIFGFYHVPGHGFIRLFDTLILGAGFSWLALRYTFFAPVVMHYIADAMIVLNLSKIPSIQPSEVVWLTKNGPTLNTFSSMLSLFLIILIPLLLIYYLVNYRKSLKTTSKLNPQKFNL
jgi:hypothetical protein